MGGSEIIQKFQREKNEDREGKQMGGRILILLVFQV